MGKREAERGLRVDFRDVCFWLADGG